MLACLDSLKTKLKILVIQLYLHFSFCLKYCNMADVETVSVSLLLRQPPALTATDVCLLQCAAATAVYILLTMYLVNKRLHV